MSHYANGHKGCCIEVDVTSPIKPIEVSYVDSLTLVGALEFNNDIVRKILSQKSKFWEYEQEVRFFKKMEEDKRISPYLRVKVKKIYAGVKMTEKNFRFLKKLINKINPNIQVERMNYEDLDLGFNKND